MTTEWERRLKLSRARAALGDETIDEVAAEAICYWNVLLTLGFPAEAISFSISTHPDTADLVLIRLATQKREFNIAVGRRGTSRRPRPKELSGALSPRSSIKSTQRNGPVSGSTHVLDRKPSTLARRFSPRDSSSPWAGWTRRSAPSARWRETDSATTDFFPVASREPLGGTRPRGEGNEVDELEGLNHVLGAVFLMPSLGSPARFLRALLPSPLPARPGPCAEVLPRSARPVLGGDCP